MATRLNRRGGKVSGSQNSHQVEPLERRALLSTAVLTGLAAGAPVPLQNVYVNTVKDQTDPVGSKVISLRDAVAIADAAKGPVNIGFDKTVFARPQTITLTGPTLRLNNYLGATGIFGPAAGVSINGGGLEAVLSIVTGQVNLSNLTITGGSNANNGGGIINSGTANLTNVTVSGNTTTQEAGGGIENTGTLVLVDCSITGNTSTAFGGGLENSGKVTASQTTFSGNSGNGGGAIDSSGKVTLTQCTVSDNTGGGISNTGTLDIVDSTVSGNTGRTAIENYSSLTVINSTLYGNSNDLNVEFSYGGAILNVNNATLVNDSISHNTAIFGGGVYDNGHLTIANTIIAGNTAGTAADGNDVFGTGFISRGRNLIGQTDGSTGWTSYDYTGTSTAPLNAGLSPFGHFGGPTETLVPTTGSPAIGHGAVYQVPPGITTDQRGFNRFTNGKVDIGAVQVQQLSPVTVTPAAGQSATAGQTASFKLGSFIDTVAGPYTLIVNWGDGSAEPVKTLTSAGTIPSLSHKFSNIGTFNVSFVIGDSSLNVSNLGTIKIQVLPAAAVTITVNSTADQTDAAGGKTVTLRDAVNQANGLFGPVIIQFDPKVFATPQTILLNSTDLEISAINGSVAIDGPASGVTVSGGGLVGVLVVDAGASVSVSNLSLFAGSSSASGASVANSGTLTIVDSTISGAAGDFNADAVNTGIRNDGTLDLVNSTICSSRGGIINNGTATLINDTITGNYAFGAGGVTNNGTLTIGNTIIAGNTDFDPNVTGELDVAGAFISLGHNLIGDAVGSTGWISTDDIGNASNLINPLLSFLSGNGGPTPTEVPTIGSPAIGKGSVSLIPAGISTDERGLPRIVGGKVDIGAVEVQGPSPLALTVSANATSIVETPASFSGSFKDSAKGTFTLFINWGDSLSYSVVPLSPTGPIPVQSYTYTSLGKFTVTAVVTDGLGNVSNLEIFTIDVVPAAAVTVTVNTTKDQIDPTGSKTVSLRDAVNLADAHNGPVTILFDPKVFATHQTITLDGTDLEFADQFAPTVITGPAAGVTINANGANAVLNVDYGSTTSISNLTLTGATSFGLGVGAKTTVADCTISGNSSDEILDVSSLTLINSTISGNAGSAGVGIYFTDGGTATLINDTITGNAGGIDMENGTVVMANTIVAGNTAADGLNDILGPVTSEGHNLIGNTNGSTGWIASDYTGTSADPLDPLLSPLGNYGGPGQTIVPAAGSIAIGNGGVNLLPAGVTTDERGEARIVNGKVDIGALEVQRPSPLAVKLTGKSSSVINSPASVTVSFTDSSTNSSRNGPYTVSLNWGDSATNTVITRTSVGSIGSQSHTYASLGTFTVTAIVSDSAGDVSNISQLSITVLPQAAITVTVNTAKDQTDAAGSKTVSLRDAINLANASFGPVTINFDPKVFATAQSIKLNGTDLQVTNIDGKVSIDGTTAGVTIDAQEKSDVLDVALGADASLSNLSIIGGSLWGLGIEGTVTATDCTVSNNIGDGGISCTGTLTLINSTVSGNASAVSSGGGISSFYGGTITLINDTITGNSAPYGPGISNGGQSVTIANTIVAGNTSSDGGGDCSGIFTSLGYNLIGETDSSSGWIASDLTGTAKKPLNAKLSALRNNGGPTQTIVPLAQSPALGAGSVSLIPSGITTDQRGKPRTIGGQIDIGAVEV